MKTPAVIGAQTPRAGAIDTEFIMSDMTVFNNASASMTSLEIADLVETRHDNVRTSIERLAEKSIIQLPSLQIVENKQSLSANNKTKAYIFTGDQGKRDSIVVVAQLSPEFTARLVDRWQELEVRVAMAQFDIPKNYTEALRLAADLSEQKAIVEAELAIAAPKAEALDRIATADGSLCLRDAAKELQMQPKQFNLWMQANKWIYKRAGGSSFVGYQDRIQAGLLEHKANIIIDEAGNERLRDQVRVTAKGLARLAALFQAEVA
jgi:phage regulator Rha-like protein